MQDRDICNVYITEYGSTYVNVEFYGAVESTFFTKEDLISMLNMMDVAYDLEVNPPDPPKCRLYKNYKLDEM